jgi:DNA-binding GntR family transcriptional regulator
VERQDTQALVEINVRFHRTISAMRPNAEATSLIQRHGKFFNAMRREWGYQPNRPQQIAREHRALLDAFRRGDGAAAERISREHIQNAMQDLLARWRLGQESQRQESPHQAGPQ